VNISKKTEKAFQILRDWDSKKYEYDQRFLFFYLNDILEIPENFTDDEDLKYLYSNYKEFYICICISFEDSKLGELYDLSISSYTPPSKLGLAKLSHG